MATSADIVRSLTAIANELTALAMLWHLVVAVALLALVRGWRPSNRNAARLLIVPLVSVAIVALVYRNPFNAALFGVASIVLAGFTVHMSNRSVARAPTVVAVTGIALLAFGWTYPHFVAVDSPLEYLYATPLGLVPCPTLSTVIGLALVGGGLRSTRWATVVAVAGLAYGAIGVLWLGVWIDAVLLAGSAVLAAYARILGGRPMLAPQQPAARAPSSRGRGRRR